MTWLAIRGRRWRLPAIAVSSALSLAGPAAACDVALALAIDVSGSVDPAEYRLQTEGLADALRDPTVADALIGARAEILVVHWTGSSRQAVAVPWRSMHSLADVEALAAEVASIPRRWRHFSTAIGDALLFTFNQFAEQPGCHHRVIDVSGDGKSNEGPLPSHVGHALAAQGVQINGLAIEGSEDDLTTYFRENVIAGPNAFVLTAQGFRDYPRAIRRKLITEVTTPVTAISPDPE